MNIRRLISWSSVSYHLSVVSGHETNLYNLVILVWNYERLNWHQTHYSASYSFYKNKADWLNRSVYMYLMIAVTKQYL